MYRFSLAVSRFRLTFVGPSKDPIGFIHTGSSRDRFHDKLPFCKGFDDLLRRTVRVQVCNRRGALQSAHAFLLRRYTLTLQKNPESEAVRDEQ